MPQTIILKIDPQNIAWDKIEQASDILKNGGLVAFPTETVYGVGVLATDQNAVASLYTLKQRDREKQFSVCIYRLQQLEEFVENVPVLAYKLIRKFWPGPLTLVLNAADGRTIGVRMPAHSVSVSLLRRVEVPMFVPSANLKGGKSPVCANDVLKALSGQIHAVIDSGYTPLQLDSTVCKVEEDSYQILRQGALAERMIKKAAKVKNILFVCTGNSCRSPMAEGIMKKMIEEDHSFHIYSAGISAFDGMQATKEAVMVAAANGIDISGHRALMLTKEMVKESDYIFVMEQMHKQTIIQKVKTSAKRVFLLNEFSGSYEGQVNIPDPIGRGMDFYEKIFDLLKNSIGKAMVKL